MLSFWDTGSRMPLFTIADKIPTKGLYKRSNFLLTVNTNRPGPKYLEALRGLRAPFLKLMESRGAFVSIRDEEVKGYREITKEEWNDIGTIVSCEVSYGVEVAPTNGSVHCHSGIKITHNSNIRLNYDTVRTFFINGVNSLYPAAKLTSLYINIKPMFGEAVIDDYVNKGLAKKTAAITLE